MAATPMVPAPMKRTWLRKVSATIASTSAARRNAGGRGQPGKQHARADQQADDHRDADRHADQMADADQRGRQAGRSRRRAGADAEGALRCLGDDLRLGEHEIEPPTTSEQHDLPQPAAVFLGPADAGADLEHFGRGDAFGIGQVGAGDERAAQRHRIHDAQDAADGDHRDRQPIRKAGPPADHDQAGQHEHDRCSVPAAEAIVWTMLFSWIVESRNALSSAIEITAAGIEVAKVMPMRSPR